MKLRVLGHAFELIAVAVFFSFFDMFGCVLELRLCH